MSHYTTDYRNLRPVGAWQGPGSLFGILEINKSCAEVRGETVP